MESRVNLMGGRTVILTGASGGIGSVIAPTLGSLDMNIVLVGRNEEKLSRVARDTEVNGGQVLVCAVDQTEMAAADEIVRKTVDAFGGIDVLINAAGLAQNAKMEDVTEEEYDAIMLLNVKAPYFLMQKALPYLRKSDAATVINLSSVVGHRGYVNQSVYGASKHALMGWSKAVANEYYKENIRVHTISPGGVYTEMVALTRPDLKEEEMILPSSIAMIVQFLLENRHTNAVIDDVCVHRANKEPF